VQTCRLGLILIWSSDLVGVFANLLCGLDFGVAGLPVSFFGLLVFFVELKQRQRTRFTPVGPKGPLISGNSSYVWIPLHPNAF